MSACRYKIVKHSAKRSVDLVKFFKLSYHFISVCRHGSGNVVNVKVLPPARTECKHTRPDRYMYVSVVHG